MNNALMDDRETLNRRARLRELIATCFNDRDKDLLDFIEQRTGKRPNQGELAGIQKNDGSKSFGDKKARTLTDQIGLHRYWFSMPLGSNLGRDKWLLPSPETKPAPVAPPLAMASYAPANLPQVKHITSEPGHNGTVRFEKHPALMSAGPGAISNYYEQDEIEHLEVARWWARQHIGSSDPKRIKVVACRGSSMAPTIDDGALMFIDIGVREFNGDGLYCMAWNEHLIVKRLIADVLDGSLRIVSDNPDKIHHKEQIVRIGEIDRLAILGQVKCWFKTCKP